MIDAIAVLRAEVLRLGSQKAFAKTYNLSENYVSNVMTGRFDPSDRILAAVGLRRQTVYFELDKTSTTEAA